MANNNTSWGIYWFNSVRTILEEKGVSFESYDSSNIKEISLDLGKIYATIQKPNGIEQEIVISFSTINNDSVELIKEFIKSNPAVAYDINLGFLHDYFLERLEELNIRSNSLQD